MWSRTVAANLGAVRVEGKEGLERLGFRACSYVDRNGVAERRW